MENHTYWHKQSTEQPLFPDIEWSKPQQKSQAGRLGIIGGNNLGFAGVAEAYQTTLATGAGSVRVLLPDTLKKMIGNSISDVIYSASNPSGSLARDAIVDMRVLGSWSSGILMIGDAGRNSETAILYETFIQDYDGPLTITRDAIDLIKNDSKLIVERPDTVIIASFAQLQKIFQNVYYPKVLTFSMHLTHLVEALHKFTVTYPATITVLHRDNMIMAHDGKVITMPWDNPMKIWRGTTAATAATYLLWTPKKPLESVATSLTI